MKNKTPFIIGGIVAAVVVAALIINATRSASGSAVQPNPVATPQEAAKPAKVDPDAQAIAVAASDKQSYEARMAAVNRLGTMLEPKQVEQVRALMNDAKAPAPVRNDAFTVLARQKSKPKGLARDLIKGWESKDESVTWKDFTLQHLEPAYAFSDAVEKKMTEETLIAAAGDVKNPSAGTAILSLERLAEKNPHLKPIAEKLTREAATSAGTDPARVSSAMASACRLGDKTVLPKARTIASSEGEQVRLRLSCMAALGTLGEATDAELLDGLTKNKETRIRRAATYQLKQLKRRLKL